MLSPVGDMYYVKSTALMTIISMMVGVQLVTYVITRSMGPILATTTFIVRMSDLDCNY